MDLVEEEVEVLCYREEVHQQEEIILPQKAQLGMSALLFHRRDEPFLSQELEILHGQGLDVGGHALLALWAG